MKHIKLVAAGALIAVNMFAFGAPPDTDVSNLPPEKTEGSATYVTGGVGLDEATAMRQAKSAYPLSLEFVKHAKPKDEFMANVEVTIKDNTGNIALKTMSDGPYLLAKLPDGKYTVIAKADGKSKTEQVTVARGKSAHLIFVW
jgi:Carboxypeptidase regulatory-like domain